MSYRHLTIDERDCITRSVELGYPISAIARIFGRSRSTIYRELKRIGKGLYDPDRAHEDYLDKRTRCRAERKLASDDMQKYVLDHLKYGWSPEQIEGHDRLEHGTPRVSARTIYRAIADGTLPPSTKDHLAFKGRRRRSSDVERRGKLKGARVERERERPSSEMVPQGDGHEPSRGHGGEARSAQDELHAAKMFTLQDTIRGVIHARTRWDSRSRTVALELTAGFF